jgi:hypothetical protein
MALQSNTSFVRPAEPGFSIGPAGAGGGTLGCVVEQESMPGMRCVLSNFHVLTGNGRFSKGEVIYQPSPIDEPAQGLGFATLLDWVPITYESSGYPNVVDAAVAQVIDPLSVTTAIHNLHAPTGINTIITKNMPVKIVGRHSDPGTGFVDDPDCRLIVDYPLPFGGTVPVGFSDQVLCTRYAVEGDSGSAVVDASGNVVGLHFMGSDDWSAFNKIDNVMSKLGVRILTA